MRKTNQDVQVPGNAYRQVIAVVVMSTATLRCMWRLLRLAMGLPAVHMPPQVRADMPV